MYAQDNILCQFGLFRHKFTTISPPILNHFWWELYQADEDISKEGNPQPQTFGECVREQVLAEVNQYLHCWKHMNWLSIIKQYPMENSRRKVANTWKGHSGGSSSRDIQKITTSMSCSNTLMSWNGGMMSDDSTIHIS